MEYSSRLVLEAVNSNLYAQSYPARAAKAVEAAETYANKLNAHGCHVQLEIVEEAGRRKVMTCTIDGKTWVRNGAFVNDPSER